MADKLLRSEPKYAGFWLRFGASVIDIIVLLAIIAPIEIAVFGLEYPSLAMAGKTLAVDIWIQLVLPLFAMIVLWRYRSATPGLMLMSAKIVDAATLAPATMGKLTLRAGVLLLIWFLAPLLMGLWVLAAGQDPTAVMLALIWVPFIPLIGVFWIAFDKRKQGWHDKIAGTVVIRD